MLRVKMASRAAPVLFSQGGLAPRKSRTGQPVPLPLTVQRVPSGPVVCLGAASAARWVLIILIISATSLLRFKKLLCV